MESPDNLALVGACDVEEHADSECALWCNGSEAASASGAADARDLPSAAILLDPCWRGDACCFLPPSHLRILFFRLCVRSSRWMLDVGGVLRADRRRRRLQWHH